VERLEQALEEWKQLQASVAKEADNKRVRVSFTEPEARLMKHGDNAIVPSYNAQISTDAEQKVIVGAHLSQSSSDSASLVPSMEVVQENMGRKPQQAVADGGFTNRESIAGMRERGIDFIGSLGDQAARQAGAVKAAGIGEQFAPGFFIFQPETNTLQCPGGKRLGYVGQSKKRGNRYYQYRAGILAVCSQTRNQNKIYLNCFKKRRETGWVFLSKPTPSFFPKTNRLHRLRERYDANFRKQVLVSAGATG
jgi:hypothetical protein